MRDKHRRFSDAGPYLRAIAQRLRRQTSTVTATSGLWCTGSGGRGCSVPERPATNPNAKSPLTTTEALGRGRGTVAESYGEDINHVATTRTCYKVPSTDCRYEACENENRTGYMRMRSRCLSEPCPRSRSTPGSGSMPIPASFPHDVGQRRPSPSSSFEV